MLRSRQIRHSASAYFTTDKKRRSAELPHTWSFELEDSPKRVRLQRAHSTTLTSNLGRKRWLTLFLVLLLGSLLFWLLSADTAGSLTRLWRLGRDTTRSELTGESLSDTKLKGPKPRPTTHRGGSKDKVRPQERNEAIHLPSTKKSHWPPLVTSIPETRPSPNAFYQGLTSSSIDGQFCQGTVHGQCRILLPLWIGEQESRSRIHLLQVLQLAQSLNRTLVLPNVGRSRIGACNRWEFEVYYDIGSFVGRKQGEQPLPPANGVRKVMLMDDFRTWMELRPERPIAQLAFVDEQIFSGSSPRENVSFFPGEEGLDIDVDNDLLDLEDPRLKKTRCLPTKFRQLDLEVYSPMSIHMPQSHTQKILAADQLLVQAVTREDVRRAASHLASIHEDDSPDSSTLPTPDVLILYWDIRHFPFLQAPDASGLAYSSKLNALADKLVDPYTSYLSVHWRMETVPPALLPDCAEALVDTLTTLLFDPSLGADIKTIWFASDFPFPVSSSSPSSVASPGDAFGQESDHMQIAISARRSNTFRSVAREHVEAIEILKSAFRSGGVLEGWKLTGVAEELDRVRREMEMEGKVYMLEEDDDDGVLLEDSGVLGILDKIAAMKAALFVSGARGCGRVSTFTKQIIDSRANTPREESLRNVVEIFG